MKNTYFLHVDQSKEILKSYLMFNFFNIIKFGLIVLFHLLCLYITDKALKNDFNIKIDTFFIWSDDFKFPLLQFRSLTLFKRNPNDFNRNVIHGYRSKQFRKCLFKIILNKSHKLLQQFQLYGIK